MRPTKEVLADHLQSINFGVRNYSAPTTIYPIINVIASIRTLAKERGDLSIYKQFNLGQVKVLTTMIPLIRLPRSDHIATAATGMILTKEGYLRASFGTGQLYSDFITFDEWWEKPHQAIDGHSLTRKEVLLASQLSGILHSVNIRNIGVKKLAELDQSHFQYVLQYGYELTQSPELLTLAE